MSAPSDSPSPGAIPYGMLALLAVTFFLYAALILISAGPVGGGGEARIAQAYETLYVAFGLWVMLAVLLLAGGAIGGMPPAAGVLWVFLVPFSGVGNFVALDMMDRHMKWAIVFPLLLPPLIAFYAFWARIPALKASLPAKPTSLAVLGAVFVLSALPMVIAAYY